MFNGQARAGQAARKRDHLSESAENERLCLTFLRALGGDAANLEIATFGRKRALVVERFERTHARTAACCACPRRTSARRCPRPARPNPKTTAARASPTASTSILGGFTNRLVLLEAEPAA